MSVYIESTNFALVVNVLIKKTNRQSKGEVIILWETLLTTGTTNNSQKLIN